jgi:hypothetical protein
MVDEEIRRLVVEVKNVKVEREREKERAASWKGGQ